MDDVVEDSEKKLLGTKESHSQRFVDETAANAEINQKSLQKKFQRFQNSFDDNNMNSQVTVSPKRENNQITIDLNQSDKKYNSN